MLPVINFTIKAFTFIFILPRGSKKHQDYIKIRLRLLESVHMWFSSPGTSGDTGGSAIQSAKGLCGLDIVVVYPRGRITPVQEKHMITCLEDNIHVFAGEPNKAT